MKTVFFSTANKHKVLELSKILSKEGIKVRQIKVEMQEPDLSSIEEVAEIKAKQAFAAIRKPVIAEDTGVYFSAYRNFPGHLAKRVYLGLGFKGLLALVKAAKNRKAFFKSVICFTKDGKRFHSFSGKLGGVLLSRVVKLQKDRLPYEKIFRPKGFKQALAELSIEEKNRVSHRAIAARKFAAWAKKNL